MYDKLVMRLRCEECLPYNALRTMHEAADAIEELSVVVRAQKAVLDKFPKWIPVTDRLPECDGERVLVASNFLTSYLRVSICYFSKNLEDVGYDFDGEKRSGFYVHDPEYGYYERQCVRYWMPLPEPPKEET